MATQTFVPSPEDRATALSLGRTQLANSITFQSSDGTETIQVPESFLKLFRRLVGVVSQGKPFYLIPEDQELTTQQAADILNVSRPYVCKLLDLGEIPHSKTGRYRRIKYCDVMEYKQKQNQRSEEALQAMADDAQALGLGY